MKNQRQKGFTLIELLVLIAIIGILSQIVLVNLRNATNKANRSSALATVSGLSGELDMCMNSQSDIQGPVDLSSGTGIICASGESANKWPTLVNTGGHCYDFDDTVPGCDNTADIMPADYAILQTFYLNNFDGANNKVNTMITYTWSKSVNLRCD